MAAVANEREHAVEQNIVLPRGQQQRVAIACALVARPDVVFLAAAGVIGERLSIFEKGKQWLNLETPDYAA
ncbi:hypothetical protein [Amycolatopsis lexingtonensis]|uniref:hypothetical protein n=1 Tax=Amycolatopsis lexingtonensis TaxID=218822 RepID=UPI003F72490F